MNVFLQNYKKVGLQYVLRYISIYIQYIFACLDTCIVVTVIFLWNIN